MYFNLGISHITDLLSYDHILFLIALSATYSFDKWKQITLLITAFTIGHSLSLVLSVFEFINLPSSLIEFLIATTILITGLSNLLLKGNTKNIKFKYTIALIFGLIHGLGFSSYFKELIGINNIIKPLFYFNLGIETGKLLIVSIFLFLNFIYFKGLNFKMNYWNYIFSGVAICISIYLMIDRFPF